MMGWGAGDAVGGGGILAAEFSTVSSGQFMTGVMEVVVGGRWRWGGWGRRGEDGCMVEAASES